MQLSDTPQITINQEDKLINNNQNQMNELELFIESLFSNGMLVLGEGQERNKENALSALKAVVSERDQLKATNASLVTEKTSLTEQITNLNAKVASLQDMATVGTNHIASLRETTVANYKKLKGDQVDETIVTMLNAETTGLVTLISLNKDYEAQLNEKFPLTCSKCGSHEVSRASSVKEPEVQQNQAKTEEEDVMANLYRSKLNPKKN
jgi:hypothetical protein